ncbi:hypothetical protein BJ170DRAFT_590102 [Xylariales sp. AK1849]|nr:hypothetical protein BJ170DRAFT_590102 [Xylariales sp. AK1849]
MASRILFRSAAAFRPAAVQTSRQIIVQRGIASTSVLRHKESDVHHNQDKDHLTEHHKQDQLKKQKEGKGHWKPELASDSEEAVKADRNEHEDVKDLQERTKAAAEETSKNGTSMRDGL